MKYSLTIAEHQWDRWLRHLADATDERMAFGFCGVNETARTIDYLVQAIDLPGDDEYRFQGVAGVSLRAEHVVRRVSRANGHAAFVDIHSHPFTNRPSPSGTDDEGAARQMRVLRDLAPGTSLIRMVVGAGGAVWAETSSPDEVRWSPVHRIVVLGRHHRREIFPVNAPTASPSQSVNAQDVRTAAVIGDGAAMTLRGLTVTVIGAGGIGSAVIAQIGGYVNRINIIDPDVVEIHNAPRLYHYTFGDEGRPKASMHAERIRRAFPESEAVAVHGAFPDDETLEAFKAADVVFCCPDHNAVRYAAARLGARFLKPIIEVGCGGVGHAGRLSALGYHVRLQVPAAPCLACNGLDTRELEDPASTETKKQAGYVIGGDPVAGELMPLTTRAAADAVDLFIRYITGYAAHVPRHLYFDALNLRTIDASDAFRQQPLCTLCGDSSDSIVGAGDSLPLDQRLSPPPGAFSHAAQ